MCVVALVLHVAHQPFVQHSVQRLQSAVLLQLLLTYVSALVLHNDAAGAAHAAAAEYDVLMLAINSGCPAAGQTATCSREAWAEGRIAPPWRLRAAQPCPIGRFGSAGFLLLADREHAHTRVLRASDGTDLGQCDRRSGSNA